MMLEWKRSSEEWDWRKEIRMEPQGTTVVSGEVEKEDLLKKSGKLPKRKEQQQQNYLAGRGGGIGKQMKHLKKKKKSHVNRIICHRVG